MKSFSHYLRVAAASSALILLAGAPTIVLAQEQSATPSSAAADNTAQNKEHNTTADQQKSDKSDRMITKNIRKSIVADKSISTYGHNVKIITQNGMVTLKGPVHSDEEKQAIGAKAADVAGQDKVTNDLTVKQ